MEHEDLIQDEFTRQAPSFEDPSYSFGDPKLLRWFVDALPLDPDAVSLEVAAGTGHVSRALSSHVRAAIAVDLTAEMLQVGQRAAREDGVANVIFQRGDAAELAYLDESFDIVLSRFAIHHFLDPRKQVAEMVRVCRPSGHVAVMDLVASDPELAASYNDLERRRDPSHVRTLTRDELRSLFENFGLQLSSEREHDQRLDLDRWLSQTNADQQVRDEITRLLEGELEGGPATGMRPRVDDDRLGFVQRWHVLVFRRA